jgi:amino acid permease
MINNQLPTMNNQQPTKFISRQEALAGFPAKRANTLLFLIENRTAHLVARSLVDFSLTESTSTNRDLAFIEAFISDRAPPLNLTIQHLERYAPQWQDLVPANPHLQAALAHALSKKYHFTASKIPNIQAVLALEQQSVQMAYLRQYRVALATIFRLKLSKKEQLKWVVAKITEKIENLPSFWLATLITIALGLPQAFLALPIAAAGMGALSSLTLVIVIGVINIITMACMAEAIARSGDFRYGKALIKDLASNYLGKAGSLILSIAVGIRVFFIALACYVGLATTMASFTPISPSIWAAVLFTIAIYLLSRQSLKLTIGIMVLLAAINLSLLLALSFFAFTHWQIDNLFYFNLPFFPGNDFKPQLIQQIFGVSLMLYFGHIYVGECAKLVLPQDRSGSSLIKGSIAGTIILTILFCIWILAVNGAIAPSLLIIQSGTVLEPLAQQIGSVVRVTGAILVIFLLGMAWIRSSSLLFNLTQEWLPHHRQHILILGAKKGRLTLQPSKAEKTENFPCLGITYLGLQQTLPLFRFDIQTSNNLTSIDLTITQRWHIRELFARFPELNHLNLELNLLSANQHQVSIDLNSSMILSYGSNKETRETTNHEQLITNYEPLAKLVQNRFLMSIIPLLIVFLLAEWLFFVKNQSFTNVLAFAGVLGNSLVGGVFPVLLFISSRRKGELVPETVLPKLDRPWLLATIYSLFIAILMIHGLFLWQEAIAKISAFAVVILALGSTLASIAAGALTPRTVIELCEETNNSNKTQFKFTAGGKPQSVPLCVGYSDRQKHYQDAIVELDSLSKLDYAICQISTKKKTELKIWAHRCNLNSDDESIPTILEIHQGEKTMQFDLKLSGGKIWLPAIANTYWLKFHFSTS